MAEIALINATFTYKTQWCIEQHVQNAQRLLYNL